MGRKILVFLVTFVLIMGFNTCFASITYEKFENILKENNLELDEDFSSNSNLINVLNIRPWIFLNADNTKLIITSPTNKSVKYDNIYYAYKSSVSNYGFLTAYTNQLTSLSSASKYGGKQIVFTIQNNVLSNPVYKTESDYPFLFYSEVKNEVTESEFYTYNYLKKYANSKTLYNDGPIYYNSNNLFYKFDGVFKGNQNQEPYTSSFKANNDMFRFEYTAYTDLTNSNVVNYFYLQEFTPSQAVNLTDEDLNFNDSDEQIVVNQKLESNFSYTSLIKRMQQGYIYRLYCFSNQHNESGELLRTTDATSCFFSLNSWKSNDITVLNIYKIMFPENPDIEQEGENSSGVTGLQNIQNGVNNINNFLNEDISQNNSGDLENALNVDVNIADPTADFFTWFFNQIVDCFTVDSNQILTFNILEKEFKINSDDYILNITILQNVIGVGSSIFIFYGIFQDIRREIEKIKEGKFEQIASEDISANMM